MKKLIPGGEQLRRAVSRLAEMKACGELTQITREQVEAVSVEFDLTPLEEEFLLKHFVESSYGPSSDHQN